MSTTPLPSRLRIATRSSELALWQARHVADLIREQFPDIEIELIDVTTQGDVDQTQPLRNIGGTGVFTKEVQRAVLDGLADLAVHSLKDLPTEVVEPRLTLAAVPAREIRWDALILPADSDLKPDVINPLACLPAGCRIGSGSLRRQAQIRASRPDVQLLEIRGNLNTRLKKLDAGEYDALILASAGVLRLGWEQRLSCPLTPPVMFPAVGQGALGIECRTEDRATLSLLHVLNHPLDRLCTQAERSLLATLRAGCHAPVGVDCTWEMGTLQLTAIVLNPEGTEQIQVTETLPLERNLDWETSLETAALAGRTAAETLIQLGAQKLITGGG